MRSSIRVVRLPGRSSGSTTASSIASPWRTWAGEVVTVTPAALAAPGQPAAPIAAASTAAAHHRPRRVILMIVPIRLDAGRHRPGHTR
ncbi:hypothetical protein [Micromonospora sp. NPDC003776]